MQCAHKHPTLLACNVKRKQLAQAFADTEKVFAYDVANLPYRRSLRCFEIIHILHHREKKGFVVSIFNTRTHTEQMALIPVKLWRSQQNKQKNILYRIARFGPLIRFGDGRCLVRVMWAGFEHSSEAHERSTLECISCLVMQLSHNPKKLS